MCWHACFGFPCSGEFGHHFVDVIVTWRSDLAVVNSKAEFEKEAELPTIYICTDPYTDCVPMSAIPERIGRSQAKNVKYIYIYICVQLARQKWHNTIWFWVNNYPVTLHFLVTKKQLILSLHNSASAFFFFALHDTASSYCQGPGKSAAQRSSSHRSVQEKYIFRPV